jgi:hypothetical protein
MLRIRKIPMFIALAFVGAGLVTAAVYRIATILLRPSANPARARYVSVPGSSSAGLLAAAMWIDRVRVYKDQPIQVNLSFTNGSANAADGLAIEFQAPGLDESGPCWLDGAPACAPGKNVAVSLPGAIKPGESIHVHAALNPADYGRFGLLAIYRWSETTAPNATRSYVRAVTLEPVEVTTRIGELLAWAASWLALPLVIGIGGALWQLWGQDREKEFEVWKEQLGKLFDYIRRYYMGVARSIFSLNKAANDLANPRQRERVFYYFVMFWMRMRVLREKGGWFLSEKKSEELLNAIWIPLWGQIESWVDDKRVDEIADILEKPVSLPRFRAEFVAPAPPARVTPAPATPPPGSCSALFVAAETEFLAWVDGAAPNSGDSFRRCLSLMLMLRMVLAFEWDRPFFGYWYGTKPEFDVDAFEGHLKNVPAGLNDLQVKAKRYAEDVRKYRPG